MNQGNFLTQNEFNIFDHNQKRRYKGNIFVFQYCVVCTERISPTKLQFKAYFPNGRSHTECIDENKFLLYERDNYKIEISSEAKIIQQMMNQIRQVLSSNRVDRSSMMSILSNASNIKSNEGNLSTQITKELELLVDCRKRSASSDSLNFLIDKETNALSADVRTSISDGSSIESKPLSFGFIFKINFKLS